LFSTERIGGIRRHSIPKFGEPARVLMFGIIRNNPVYAIDEE
jgi:hypothetical protein